MVGLAKKITEQGKKLSFSSLRMETLNDELVDLILQSGQKTLTIAVDAPSERMRDVVNKAATDEFIIEKCRFLTEKGILHLKIYSIIGLPGEEDEDIDDEEEDDDIHEEEDEKASPFGCGESVPTFRQTFRGSLVEGFPCLTRFLTAPPVRGSSILLPGRLRRLLYSVRVSFAVSFSFLRCIRWRNDLFPDTHDRSPLCFFLPSGHDKLFSYNSADCVPSCHTICIVERVQKAAVDYYSSCLDLDSVFDPFAGIYWVGILDFGTLWADLSDPVPSKESRVAAVEPFLLSFPVFLHTVYSQPRGLSLR